MSDLPYPNHDLAQVNIAKAKYPTEDPRMSDFMNGLEPINALAEDSAGFVWRLQDETGAATGTRVFDDDQILINLSSWDSVDALWEFVSSEAHRSYMRRRKEWFERIAGVYTALWWVEAGHRPTPTEAKRAIARITIRGSSPKAFTFADAYDPDGNPIKRGDRG